ncbi:conserved hypothethical protein (plasmid) [Ralstonia solanacearum PSI07]|nr:conserved hypothethical protein [Ralstonia solanacearum PSI07]
MASQVADGLHTWDARVMPGAMEWVL